MPEHRTVTVPNVDLDELRVQYQAVMKLVDFQREYGLESFAAELDTLEGLENLLSAMVNAQQGVTHADHPSNAAARLVDGVTTCECGSTSFEVAEHGAYRQQLSNADGVVRFGGIELDDSDYQCTACGRTVALQSVATVQVPR